MFFEFLALRPTVELHNLTGRVIECPLDEMNRPRSSVLGRPAAAGAADRVEIEALFAGWREELASCRKFGPAAHNYAVTRLASDVSLRINEARVPAVGSTQTASWSRRDFWCGLARRPR